MTESREDPEPHTEFHDGDDGEAVSLYGADVSVEAHGVRIYVRAAGETAVHDVQVLLDKAVEAVAKIQTQIQ